jgi:Xaa-Pro dipeptidase
MDPIRVSRVRDALVRAGLDALICRLPENVVFLTGYWPRNGFCYVVFPQQAEPTLILPEGEIEWAEMSGLKDIRLFGWGQVKDTDPYETIAAHLEAIPALTGRVQIGYEGRFEVVAPAHMPGDVQVPSEVTRELFRNSLPAARFVDATDVLNGLRAVKTEYELGKIRIANEVACFGLKALRDNMRPGLTEAQVAGLVTGAIHAQAAGYKGVISAWGFPTVVSGAATTATAHRPYQVSTSKPLQEGDLVMMELGCVVDGYWADLTRTHVVGRPDTRQQDAYQLVLAAHDAAIAALKPGAREADVDHAARSIIERAGFGPNFVHHTGHGLGFRYHEPIPFLHPAAKGKLQEGMVTSIEPGIYIDGWGGIRIEDNVVVRPNGGEILSVFDTTLAG